ncbi:uncharacterized protein (TIGR02217 family) [Bradyrhizobium elkanii]|jgi:uncharacterized protein (TIGR02217 family)|uniref:DUF2460 domain-containing protein n=1 Tax=Bradyrhizobium elkanii TaxID=29448 RepID=UPI002166EF40|nr:DUF2460 domain-containing protein [Bradyrhizobium elkanii]MCS3690952.1 uncharacterized protein (TIGR02217 family) [Bradyrhizobium elkanii]
MTIPLYRLPPNIEIGSQFSPVFSNVIQEAVSGNEQRFGRWTKCRSIGNVAYGLLTSDDHEGDFAAIMAIYRAHIQELYPFRFRDWSDYTTTNEQFGTGDGATTSFQLVKVYDPGLILLGVTGALRYVREITLLAPETDPVIKVDGVTKTETTDYTISSSGLVTFTSAPAVNKPITWTGEFDVPVRFDGPIQLAPKEANIVTITSLPIREVIGES